MRFRIRSPEEGEGIDLLPVGGSLAAAASAPCEAAEQADAAIEGFKRATKEKARISGGCSRVQST